MYRREVKIKNTEGLHARPASLFVREASKYSSEIFLEKDNKKVNGKSILGVLGLGAALGDRIIISAEGEDAQKAVNGLEFLVEGGFEREDG